MNKSKACNLACGPKSEQIAQSKVYQLTFIAGVRNLQMFFTQVLFV